MYPIQLKFSAITTTVIFLYVFNISQTLKVIPQRVNLTYINHKYVDWANLTIKRYGRKSDYYINLEGKKYHTWENNVSIHFIFNEYLHNEYRRSFVEMHFKICDLINKDKYIGAMVASKGITCPITLNEAHLMNMSLPTQDFAYEFPFEKARVDGTVKHTATGEHIAEGHMFLLFKNGNIK